MMSNNRFFILDRKIRQALNGHDVDISESEIDLWNEEKKRRDLEEKKSRDLEEDERRRAEEAEHRRISSLRGIDRLTWLCNNQRDLQG